MFIEDEELRNIFKTASEEHLQKLDDGLLYLEKTPQDKAKLEELMREAHSLKGDAGMLGVKDIATLAHQVEHILGTLKRGETELTSIVSDRLYQGLDAIRQLSEEAVTGISSSINTFYVLAYMMGANTSPPSPSNKESESQEGEQEETKEQHDKPIEEKTTAETPDDRVFSIPSSAQEPQIPLLYPGTELVPTIAKENPQDNEKEEYPPSPQIPLLPTPVPTLAQRKETVENEIVAEPSHPRNSYTSRATKETNPSRFAIESVRVETRHLDSLMTQAGELTVTKIRINHRLSEVEEIVNLCDEWNRQRVMWNRVTSHSLENLGNWEKEALEVNQYSFDSPNLLVSHTLAPFLKLKPDSVQSVEQFFDILETLVNRLRNSLYEDTQRLEIITDELADGIRTMRLLPLLTIFNLFPRMVRDLAKQQGKEIELVIEGGETKADKRILEEMKDPLMHIIRNCIDHGIETPEERLRLGKPTQAKILLKAKQTATSVVLEVTDDGRGLDIEKIKQTALKRRICREEELAAMTGAQIQALIFTPGFSTRTFVTEVSGRGVGLDVVRTNVENLKGTLQVESTPNVGCTIRMSLPTSLATAHVLIVGVDGISYAIPVEYVQMARLVAPEDIFPIEGQDTILLDSYPVSVARLADLLELENGRWKKGNTGKELSETGDRFSAIASSHHTPCIILKVGDATLGLLVDALLDEQDVMLKPQSKLLKRVRNVSGATILGTGEVCMVLNPQDLIKSVRKQAAFIRTQRQFGGIKHQSFSKVKGKQAILLVEDSIAIRTQEKRILEGAGYEVVTAVDGLDALSKLKTRSFDAIVSDIQMPNLDGLALTAKIRQYKEYSELPIILVTSLASDEDKRKGAEVGANAYITKGTFNQEVLLDTLRRLV